MTEPRTAHVELPAATIVLPTGATLDDWYDVRSFTLWVRWRGPRTDTGRGGYAVTTWVEARELSRAGNWKSYVAPFQQHQYRWATHAEALTAAHTYVDTLRVNGRTWAEHRAGLNSR